MMAICPKCQRSFSGAETLCPHDGAVLLREGSASLEPDLRPGHAVGEYVVEEKIGSGTFGDVYRAIQPLIAKQVAIKVLNRKYSSDPEVVSRFIAEARAVNQIRHRNIIDIFSFGQLPDGRHYHIMELLHGSTLEAHLRQRGRLRAVEALLVLRPLGRALDAAHAAGIAHRDLKPANVFLAADDDGRPFPKLLDFGIAKLLTDQLPRAHQTATGATVGTPDYMSPEQCQGANVDHRTDVYAFGIMTYQLVTGRLPFVGESVVDVLVKQMTAAPQPPSAVCPDLPADLDAPILSMLEKDRARRPPSLAAALDALEASLNASGFAVPRTGTTGDPEGAPLSPGWTSSASRRASTAWSEPPWRGAEPSVPGAVLREPPLTATLPSDLRSLPGADDPGPAPPTRRYALGGLGLAIAVAVGIAAVRRPSTVEVAPVVVPALASAPEDARVEPEPAPPADPPREPPPATIRLEVRSSQSGVEIVGPGGVVLGRTLGRGPTTLELPRGREKLTLSFRGEGLVAETRELVPLADGALDIELAKRPPAAPKASPAKPKKKAGADDLEAFD